MPEETTITYLLTQGVLGIACLALIIVVRKLYNKCEELRKENIQLHEARLNDSKEIGSKAIQVMEAFSQTSNMLSSKLLTGKRQDGNGS